MNAKLQKNDKNEQKCRKNELNFLKTGQKYANKVRKCGGGGGGGVLGTFYKQQTSLQFI